MARILFAAYPLTRVEAGACGGAEQVLRNLLQALARNGSGHELVTVARSGSRVPGRLLTAEALTPFPNAASHRVDAAVGEIGRDGLIISTVAATERSAPGALGPAGLEAAPAAPLADAPLPPERLTHRLDAYRTAIIRLVRAQSFDLVQDHGAGLAPFGAQLAAPLLVTLHLARSLYSPGEFDRLSGNTWLQGVSRTQWEVYRRDPACARHLAGWVGNGVDLEEHRCELRKSPFLLFLGRICPEKGPDRALALAGRLGRTLVIAGQIYPFPSHQAYFREQVAPRLGPKAIWMGRPNPRMRRWLLQHAAAVVIPSAVEETSSLVAMEAAASGTPVLALRCGALPEIVVQGETGWIGASLDELATWSRRLPQIDPRRCRREAERRFDARVMADGYAALYERLLARSDRLRTVC